MYDVLCAPASTSQYASSHRLPPTSSIPTTMAPPPKVAYTVRMRANYPFVNAKLKFSADHQHQHQHQHQRQHRYQHAYALRDIHVADESSLLPHLRHYTTEHGYDYPGFVFLQEHAHMRTHGLDKGNGEATPSNKGVCVVYE